MAVISGLLNDESKDYANKKITLIPIDEIFPNPLNKAPIMNIDDLVISIKESGLRSPLSVYKLENHHYVILNGERRYTALQQMNQEEVPVIIEPRPTSLLEERLIILDANSQREETKEYKKLRAIEYEELYHLLKENGSIEKGKLKIDWIGNHMGISGRQVQRYLPSDQQHGHDVHIKKVKVSALSKKMSKTVIDIQEIDIQSLNQREMDLLKEMISKNIATLGEFLIKIA